MEQLKGKNLLLADDDPNNIFALTAALDEYDMNVTVVGNGQEAVDALNDDHNIDIVLMDMMMPEMDGYEAMEAIREINQYKDLPIIALTAKAMQGDKERCIEAGASDYMSKPIDVNALVALIRKLLEKNV